MIEEVPKVLFVPVKNAAGYLGQGAPRGLNVPHILKLRLYPHSALLENLNLLDA